MKAFCTILLLIILAAGGAIALKTLAPERLDALAGAVRGESAEAPALDPEPEPPAAPAPAPEPKPEPKPETKPEPKPEPAPAPAPEPKPQAKAAPEPNAAGQIGWGVVTAPEAKAYGKDGKVVAEIPGGEVFVVLKVISANGKPAYYVCLDKRPKKPECALLGGDCRVFLAPPPEIKEDVDAFVAYSGNRRALGDYYAALAMRAKLEQRARDRHLAKSPAKDLPKLKAQLADVPETDRRYEAAQKRARTNAERLKYQDLRKELRYTATGLRQEIKRLEAAKKSWEAAHPYDEAAIRSNAVWRRLTQNIKRLEPKAKEVEATAPGA